ncbi:MAG: hypothetical protein MSA90_15865 [Faecalicatena sp.]|uniref:hypothetical protein n=1 Tax=Faecalicatena sp. TaxID=2005360 RepID=UPI00258FE305|nr:hypothetical protein [Faecalicatena sp.]MCI6466928.1 hypothetical protein [Faecalicatena sp.]MDY5617636.1 hypothetical protein [Lachnospiraceae bacterium]
MMSKYRFLLKLQLYNLFGINRLIHSHDKQERQRFLITASLGLTAALIFVIYTAKFSSHMAKAGLAGAIPTIMVVLCALSTLILTFVKSTGVLIGLKDYDLVMSMPVNTIAIVASRITLLYLINLFLGSAAMLPSCILYVIYVHPPLSSYFFLLGALLFTPVIPMVLSLSLGVWIVAASSGTKHSNLCSLILSTTVVLLTVFASVKTQFMDMTQITDLGRALADAVNKYYPPASLITRALSDADWGSFLLFLLISILLGAIFTGIVSHYYKALNTAAFSYHAGRKYQIGMLKASSPFIALYKKELGRLTSCTIYALNSCIGIVLLFILTVIAVFFLPPTLKRQLETQEIKRLLGNLMPLVLSLFVSMTSTTAPSLSLEGKNRWIMCSVPVPSKTIFDAKIAVNLTVILPVLYVSVFLLRIAFPFSGIQTVRMFLIPTVYALFISVLGLFLNIRFPKYDWTSEYYAVKGGAVSVIAAIMTGMASSLIPLYLCLVLPQYQMGIILGFPGFLLAVSIVLYGNICRTSLYM